MDEMMKLEERTPSARLPRLADEDENTRTQRASRNSNFRKREREKLTMNHVDLVDRRVDTMMLLIIWGGLREWR